MYKVNDDLTVFTAAFEAQFKRAPMQYIDRKINSGSRIEDVEYLFNLISAEVSKKNKCKFYSFDYFYKKHNTPTSRKA